MPAFRLVPDGFERRINSQFIVHYYVLVKIKVDRLNFLRIQAYLGNFKDHWFEPELSLESLQTF